MRVCIILGYKVNLLHLLAILDVCLKGSFSDEVVLDSFSLMTPSGSSGVFRAQSQMKKNYGENITLCIFRSAVYNTWQGKEPHYYYWNNVNQGGCRQMNSIKYVKQQINYHYKGELGYSH